MSERWQTTPATIVFEDDEIQIFFKPGGSNYLLITFGDALLLADGKSFAADSIVERNGLNCLGFTAKSANWYPKSSMAACLPFIDYTLKSFPQRVLYGCSMGAYAAIKFARLFGGTDIIAYCPQWSIDPAECAEPSRYANYFRPFMSGMGITRREMSGRINIFFDPGFRPDQYHFQTIQR